MANVTSLDRFFTRRRTLDSYIQENSLINVFTCPCCAFPTLFERSAYEICAVCNWEDDGQDDLNASETLGGPNGNLSLVENRIKLSLELEEIENKLHLKVTEDPQKIFDKTESLFSKEGEYRLNREKLLSLLME